MGDAALHVVAGRALVRSQGPIGSHSGRAKPTHDPISDIQCTPWMSRFEGGRDLGSYPGERGMMLGGKAASAVIPIVTTTGDPVAIGLIPSLAHQDGQLAGDRRAADAARPRRRGNRIGRQQLLLFVHWLEAALDDVRPRHADAGRRQHQCADHHVCREDGGLD